MMGGAGFGFVGRVGRAGSGPTLIFGLRFQMSLGLPPGRAAPEPGNSVERPGPGVHRTGGGFLSPNTSPGDRVLTGHLSDATLRLVSASPEFGDRLGPSKLDCAFRAPLDQRLANVLAARLDTILAKATPR
ncbi:hypothetical protein ARNL5_03614 [Anaerolineae bacterium]|nr:hypothetical protein ARNL5_03614 [Anaerolineae bacterium]